MREFWKFWKKQQKNEKKSLSPPAPPPIRRQKEGVMSNFKQKFKKAAFNFWRDESGQGATEYILVLVVIGVLVIAFKDTITAKVGEATTNAGDKIKNAVTKIGGNTL